MIHPIYLDRLEAAARAATQGEWISTGIVIGVPDEGGLNYIIESLRPEPLCDADMNYLELAQPANILLLTAAIRELLEKP